MLLEINSISYANAEFSSAESLRVDEPHLFFPQLLLLFRASIVPKIDQIKLLKFIVSY